MHCPEFADEDYIINDSIEMMLRGKKGHKRAGSATPMKLIGEVGRIGDKVTSVFGNIASEITGKSVFNPNSAHSIVLEALEKTRSSEAMGRRIWMSYVVENHNSLVLEDFQEVLGPAYKDEAEEAFYMIDGDDNGDISLDEMVRKVVEIGTERKAIAEGMKDIGQALRAFDKILLFVVLLIVVFIFRKSISLVETWEYTDRLLSCLLPEQFHCDSDYRGNYAALALFHFRCHGSGVPGFLHFPFRQAPV
jgi:hypothetical protein